MNAKRETSSLRLFCSGVPVQYGSELASLCSSNVEWVKYAREIRQKWANSKDGILNEIRKYEYRFSAHSKGDRNN